MALVVDPNSEYLLLGQLLTQPLDAIDFDRPEVENAVILSIRHGLAPMLYWTFNQVGYAPELEAMRLVKREAQRAAANYVIFRSAFMTLQDALEREKILCLAIKGFALAHSVYPQPSLRPMVDLDVLVPFANRLQALQIARGLGFRPRERPELFRGENETKHHYNLSGDLLVGGDLELHYWLGYWLGNPRKALRGPTYQNWFWSQTVESSFMDLHFSSPRPEVTFFYLCVHAVLQHRNSTFLLRRFFDLHRLILNSPGFEWELVIQQAAQLGWISVVQYALGITCTYFSTPLPAGLADEFERSGSSHEQPILRPDTPTNRWQSNLNGMREQSWFERLERLAHLAVPSAEYMRWRYQLDAGWKLPFSYVYRWWDVLTNPKKMG